MRVTVYQLFARGVSHIVDIEKARLPFDVHMEQDLHQHIAELLAHVKLVIGVQRFARFIDFLDEIAANALVCLSPIPRAALLGTKERNEAHKIFQAILILALKI